MNMDSTTSLTGIVLNVKEPEKLARFYCEALGMSRCDRDGEINVGYGGKGAALILRQNAQTEGTYTHAANHRYWKIAITLPNLDLAHLLLTQAGVKVTYPHQFREIAYMSHLADPEGHVIELIQHTFEGNPRTSDGETRIALGGGAQIGLITLRTNQIEADMAFCLEVLRMRFLSRQTVSDLGFDLYFFALTDEMQPDTDVDGVDNREWLWQRPYTTLEFQHRLNGPKISRADADALNSVRVIFENRDGSRTTFC